MSDHSSPAELTADLKAYAQQIGFHLVGITSPEPFAEAEVAFVRWLREGHQGEMAWLDEARARLACRPRDLLADARSLIVVGVSYRTVEPGAGESAADAPGPNESSAAEAVADALRFDAVDAVEPRGRISRYAWGDDYHDAMKLRLRNLAAFLRERAGPAVQARPFVDSGPLVERDAAVRAGLGFRGKNTNLLTPIGSFVFLGALLTNVELAFDEPAVKDCGTCRLCLDACPTDALATPYHLAAERCIAYLTIEHRGPIPDHLRPQMGDWIFGCDVCQDVCPYNRSVRGKPTGWPEFQPRPGIGTRPPLTALLSLDDEAFRQTFRRSPVKRTKRRGLARNAAIALGNRATAAAAPTLERAARADPEPVVREAATWALRRVRRRVRAARATGEPR